MTLNPETVLQCAPGLALTLRSQSDLELTLAGHTLRGTPDTLAVLDAFSRARPLVEGLERLRPRVLGARNWIELTAHVLALYRFGALQTPDPVPPVWHAHPTRFDNAPVHIRMLNDRRRTAAFQQAIRDTVRPGDVVVDIGTGTGILAATAALAGAGRVYAIEATPVARLAREVFRSNGLEDRITVLEGRSTQVTVPEKADVVVSEIIGDDPLNEGVLPVMADAVVRLLKPGGRLIPHALRVYGLPLSIPEAYLGRYVFTAHTASQWAAWYGVDFGALVRAAQRCDHTWGINTWKVRAWPFLSDPVPLITFDLGRVQAAVGETTHRVTARQTGLLNGILIYFEAGLGGGSFSIHPDEATPENSWRSMVWMPGTPVPVRAGSVFTIRYRFGAEGSSFDVEAG